MPFQNNYFLHAVAGSGKTTKLVKLALRAKNKKILITTYTNKNTNEIKNKIIEKFGYIPENIEVKTWFGFLLSDCIRPYQRVLGLTTRVSDMYFTVQDPHNKKLPNGTIIKTAKREDSIK
ncbi:MAG: UvrD-helicase domain-containing protein, partial [Candidatus Gastranaerophilaceae bacterium]